MNRAGWAGGGVHAPRALAHPVFPAGGCRRRRPRPAGHTCGVSRLTWLSEWSADVVRDVLNRAERGLGDGVIVLSGSIDDANPLWSCGSAVIGGRIGAKFAFSEPTARRRWHEAQVPQALEGRPELRLPEAVAAGSDPVFVATRLVGGVPLSYELVSAANREQAGQIGRQIAVFLARLHEPEILARVAAAEGRVRFPDPPPRATTGELRRRLTPLVRPDQADLVRWWCGWADDVLAVLTLRVVADLETGGAAEPEYDLRYLPAHGTRRRPAGLRRQALRPAHRRAAEPGPRDGVAPAQQPRGSTVAQRGWPSAARAGARRRNPGRLRRPVKGRVCKNSASDSDGQPAAHAMTSAPPAPWPIRPPVTHTANRTTNYACSSLTRNDRMITPRTSRMRASNG